MGVCPPAPISKIRMQKLLAPSFLPITTRAAIPFTWSVSKWVGCISAYCRIFMISSVDVVSSGQRHGRVKTELRSFSDDRPYDDAAHQSFDEGADKPRNRHVQRDRHEGVCSKTHGEAGAQPE